MAQAYGFMTGDGGGQKSTDNNNVEWQKQQWDDYLKAISVPSGMNPRLSRSVPDRSGAIRCQSIGGTSRASPLARSR